MMKLELDYELTSPTFKYVESLWFRYTDMVIKMQEIEQDGINNTDDNRDIKGKGGTSNPTESQVMRMEHLRKDKQYLNLEKNVKVIEDILNRLPSDYLKVVRSRYFSKQKKSWEMIATESKFSERHARRIRNMVVVATAELLGLW